MNSITLQEADVGEPLASVSRILDKGSRVVFSRGPGGSFVENEETAEWMPLKEERGTFILEVDLLEAESASPRFSPGRASERRKRRGARTCIGSGRHGGRG